MEKTTLTTNETLIGTEYAGKNSILGNPGKWVDEIFLCQPKGKKTANQYKTFQKAAKAFAKTIVEVTPVGPDQKAALIKFREVVMSVNVGIALQGKYLV
jgi:hypothetical protein